VVVDMSIEEECERGGWGGDDEGVVGYQLPNISTVEDSYVDTSSFLILLGASFEMLLLEINVIKVQNSL
jgi:hypothetical protein